MKTNLDSSSSSLNHKEGRTGISIIDWLEIKNLAM